MLNRCGVGPPCPGFRTTDRNPEAVTSAFAGTGAKLDLIGAGLPEDVPPQEVNPKVTNESEAKEMVRRVMAEASLRFYLESREKNFRDSRSLIDKADELKSGGVGLWLIRICLT